MIGIIVGLLGALALPFIGSAIKSHRDSRWVTAHYKTYYGFEGSVSFHYPISEKALGRLVSKDIISKGGAEDTKFEITRIA